MNTLFRRRHTIQTANEFVQPTAPVQPRKSFRFKVLCLVATFIVLYTLVVFKLVVSKNATDFEISVNHYNFNHPYLDKQLNGLKIAQLSDIHYRGINIGGTNDVVLSKAVQAINDSDVDLVFLTGDFVDLFPEYMNDLAQKYLGKLKSNFGVYAVLGNHDYQTPQSRNIVINSLKNVGIQVLMNEVVHLNLTATHKLVEIGGLGDLRHEYNLNSVLQHFEKRTQEISVNGDPIRIVLTHNPDSAEHLHVLKPHLILSGHTHGANFCVPIIFRQIVPLLAKIPSKYRSYLIPHSSLLDVVDHWEWTSGWNEIGPVRNNRKSEGNSVNEEYQEKALMYTNTGTSSSPRRIWCKSEISVFTVDTEKKNHSTEGETKSVYPSVSLYRRYVGFLGSALGQTCYPVYSIGGLGTPSSTTLSTLKSAASSFTGLSSSAICTSNSGSALLLGVSTVSVTPSSSETTSIETFKSTTLGNPSGWVSQVKSAVPATTTVTILPTFGSSCASCSTLVAPTLGTCDSTGNCALSTPPCSVSDWASWGSCSVSCGGGTKLRTRSIAVSGDGRCPSLSETAACNTQACPVDCVLSNWGVWSHCSENCGSTNLTARIWGQQTRSRSILVPSANGGAPCDSLSQVQNCKVSPPCDWTSPWYCFLPPDAGTCVNKTLRYYYNPMTTDCHGFYYGQCRGNANTFTTQQECTSACNPCIRVRCPSGRACSVNRTGSAVCTVTKDKCSGVTCGTNEKCIVVNDYATCISTDPCAKFYCPDTFTCKTANGFPTCVVDTTSDRDPCLDISCPSGYSCTSNSTGYPQCVSSGSIITPDICKGFYCSDGFRCDVTQFGNPTCVAISKTLLDDPCNEFYCPVNTTCVVNRIGLPECASTFSVLFKDPCATFDCPPSAQCTLDKAKQPKCIFKKSPYYNRDPCNGVMCPSGLVCSLNEVGRATCKMALSSRDPCLGVRCFPGYYCKPDANNQGYCAPQVAISFEKCKDLAYYAKNNPNGASGFFLRWPISPSTRFQCSEGYDRTSTSLTFLDIIAASPSSKLRDSNPAWFTLAEQFITAKLNRANGCMMDSKVETISERAQDMLEDCDGYDYMQSRFAQEYANVLKNFNKGAQ